MASIRYLSGVAVSIAIAACSSGSAPLAQQHSFQRDPPTASGDSSQCAVCAARLRCIGTFEGVPVDVVISTKARGTECVAFDFRLRCDGQLVVGSTQQTPGSNQGDVPVETSVGTWTALGGGFIVCAKGDCVVCTPTDDPLTNPDPQPQPGDNDAGVRGGGSNPDAG